jgi:CRISPR-associated protein Csm2
MAADTTNIKRLIQSDNPELLVDQAFAIGRKLAIEDKLTTNQIRNVFGEARKIQARWQSPADTNAQRTSLVLLKPKLAFQSARHRSVIYLQECVSAAIDGVIETTTNREQTEYERFVRFMNFFEAILAYHKFHGGRDQ